MSHESSGRRLIKPLIPPNRVISKFPQAFHADGTPHQKINFHPKVKEACTLSKTGTVGLKICKGVIVGDVAVGKTSLVNRFCHDIYDRDYKATIGVDFEVEKFSILSVPFNLQLWDTAGQERFKCIAAAYYRGANAVIVGFDLTDIESLRNVPKWKEDACRSADDPLVFLVGLKKDLVSHKSYEAIEESAIEVANQIGAEYWAASSLTGENVKDFFFRLVSLTFDKAVMREIDTSNNTTPKQIGGSLVRVEKREEDLYEKKKHKCCV